VPDCIIADPALRQNCFLEERTPARGAASGPVLAGVFEVAALSVPGAMMETCGSR
jgi:hypothetical protein